MKTIYFEQQVASLCGQHLLNNLLQGPYFQVSDLSDIALELDQKERTLGLSVNALRESSQNVDSGGNFSVQVLEVALENLGVKLSREPDDLKKALEKVDDANQLDLQQIAFAFNFEEHWFCARWLHDKYWVLNSVEPEPRPISRTMLTMYVSQLLNEGYTVFITIGQLPPPAKMEGNERNCFVVDRPEKPKSESENKLKAFQGKGYSLKATPTEFDEDDPELMEALQASLNDFDQGSSQSTSVLEEEPKVDDKSAIPLQLILPSGKKVRRRFKSTSLIEQVVLWAKTFPDVQNKRFSLQHVLETTQVDLSQPIASLGSGCSLRVVIL